MTATNNHEKLREIAEAATPGAWEWTPDLSNDAHAADCGPNLESNNGRLILGAWGHDWYGTSVGDADAEYIAAANPATVLALLDRIAELEARA